jgi:short subunit dehydrogenase-like uncharacterized protein
MSTRNQWLIYGATGYTGRRTAEWAVANGMKPVLAARRAAEVKMLAERLGLQWEAFDLTDVGIVTKRLSKYSTVLHCAGPFIDTWQPMIEACIAAGTHYLDITGEVDVYEGLAAHEAQAKQAGVMMMPAVGFDMVPGDCLALALKERMPDADTLEIGYSFDGTITRGSIRSALKAFTPDAQVRRGNQMVRLAAPESRKFDFGPKSAGGEVDCYSNTFGDVSIGWRTTRIPNVTAYLHITEAFQKLATLTGEADILKLPEGPSEDELKTHSAFIVGEVRNIAGKTCRARMTTPQVYAVTFPLAATIAQRVHDGAVKPGFQTGAGMFGKDFILGFAGCRLEWLP